MEKKVYVDKRNWKAYNINDGKRGRPFEFPKQFIQFNALIHQIFYLPYRQLEGFLKKRRGWMKVHLAGDTKNKRIVGIEVTDESVKDNEKFGDLIKQSQKNLDRGRIKRALADGSYDTKEGFNILEKEGIEAVIKIGEDASTKAGAFLTGHNLLLNV